jgi:hypothetical protein
LLQEFRRIRVFALLVELVCLLEQFVSAALQPVSLFLGKVVRWLRCGTDWEHRSQSQKRHQQAGGQQQQTVPAVG